MANMLVIRTGDAYPIKIKVLYNGDEITPTNAENVRIGIGDFISEWPDGTLTYENDRWNYPLTQDISTALPLGLTEIMAQVSTDGENYYPSDEPIPVMIKKGMGKAGD